jgi:hypothetical protein
MTPECLQHLRAYHHQSAELPSDSVSISLGADSVGTVETIGYTEPDAARRVADFLRRPQTFLVDIRYALWSRWRPEWNKNALYTIYGRRYLHIHGISSSMIASAPIFPEVWPTIEALFQRFLQILVYNAAFDARLLRVTAQRYGYRLPEVTWSCFMEQYAIYRGYQSLRREGICQR